MRTIIEQIEPTGFLKNYISYASTLTDAPLEFHLGAGLTILSTACGSRIVYPGYGGRRQWPNLYTLLIAPSGLYRKSTSVGIAEDILKEADENLILIGEQSREKFLAILKDRPNMMYPISEFAAILSMWNRDYSQGFREIVVDLFDCRQKYIRDTIGGEKLVINQPALNILAASTLEWLKEKLTEGDLRGGLMGRFIIVPGINKTDDPGLKITVDKEKRRELSGFLSGLIKTDHSWVDVSKIITEYNGWVKKVEGEMEKEYTPELLGFQSRLASHVLKLAVLICISEEPEPIEKYIVLSSHLEKAILLGKWLLIQATELATTGFVKSKIEGNIQKLLSMAKRNGGVPRSEAMRFLHCSARELTMLVNTAVERKELKVEKERGVSRPAEFYITIIPEED